MQVKHLIETLSYLDPDVLVVTDSDDAPHLRLESRWRLEINCGKEGKGLSRIEYRLTQSDAMAQADHLSESGDGHPVITRIDALVIS